jgi:hypothetical protein
MQNINNGLQNLTIRLKSIQNIGASGSMAGVIFSQKMVQTF